MKTVIKVGAGYGDIAGCSSLHGKIIAAAIRRMFLSLRKSPSRNLYFDFKANPALSHHGALITFINSQEKFF